LNRPSSLCANITETPSPPSITVEGGERIQLSAQVESQAVAGQTGGVGGSAAEGGRAERARPERRSCQLRRRRAGPCPRPGGSGEAQAPAVHCRVQAFDSGASRGVPRRRRHRRLAPPRGVVFVPPDNLAPPEGARGTRCLGSQEARTQIHSQSAGGGKPAPAERECPSEPPPRTSRAHHRRAKKVSALLGISLPEVKSGEENS